MVADGFDMGWGGFGDGGSAFVGEGDVPAPLVGGAFGLVDQASFLHSGDVMGDPALLPSELAAELVESGLIVGPVGEVGQDEVVLIGQPVAGQLPAEVGAELEVHE